MIAHNFLNWSLALDMLKSISHTNAYGVISLLHQGIQGCSGSPVKSTSCIRLPTHPLDLLWFYRTVESVILNWELDGKEKGNSTEIENILKDPLLSKLGSQDQAALKKFASLFMSMPREVIVDDSFCCWLFAETIITPGFLFKALNGSLSENVRKQENADFDTWAKMWT